MVLVVMEESEIANATTLRTAVIPMANAIGKEVTPVCRDIALVGLVPLSTPAEMV